MEVLRDGNGRGDNAQSAEEVLQLVFPHHRGRFVPPLRGRCRQAWRLRETSRQREGNQTPRG